MLVHLKIGTNDNPGGQIFSQSSKSSYRLMGLFCLWAMFLIDGFSYLQDEMPKYETLTLTLTLNIYKCIRYQDKLQYF